MAKTKAEPTSFVARIIKELQTFADNIPLPDAKHNAGRLLAQAFLWDVVRKHAEKQSLQMWEHLKNEGLIPQNGSLEPGAHVLCESPRFVCTARISIPVKRFSPEELSKLLKASKYRVPEPITIEFVEKAKVPSKSSTTLSVVER